jgi:hypothetical protein
MQFLRALAQDSRKVWYVCWIQIYSLSWSTKVIHINGVSKEYNLLILKGEYANV